MELVARVYADMHGGQDVTSRLRLTVQPDEKQEPKRQEEEDTADDDEEEMDEEAEEDDADIDAVYRTMVAEINALRARVINRVRARLAGADRPQRRARVIAALVGMCSAAPLAAMEKLLAMAILAEVPTDRQLLVAMEFERAEETRMEIVRRIFVTDALLTLVRGMASAERSPLQWIRAGVVLHAEGVVALVEALARRRRLFTLGRMGDGVADDVGALLNDANNACRGCFERAGDVLLARMAQGEEEGAAPLTVTRRAGLAVALRHLLEDTPVRIRFGAEEAAAADEPPQSTVALNERLAEAVDRVFGGRPMEEARAIVTHGQALVATLTYDCDNRLAATLTSLFVPAREEAETTEAARDYSSDPL